MDACKPSVKKSWNKPKPTSDDDYKPWFDQSCKAEKQSYFKAKNASKRRGEKSVSNKLSKDFKKFLDSKKAKFTREVNKKLKNVKSSCPRDYWNIINKSAEGKKVEAKVSLDTFYEHFKDLSVTKPETEHATNESPDPSPFLNKSITPEEVLVVAKVLKMNKASGPDGIRNEFLRNLPNNLIELFSHFFNKILDTGLIPEEWSVGIILPLYKKKGPQTDPSNYRGITLLSCLGKLFTAILNRRITQFMGSNNLLGMEQAGFRASHSTQDHVFVLHHIIDYYRQQNKRVYCAFVDYSKAFDLVNRSALWSKLLSTGISGKILTVIKSMYESAKSCVRTNGSVSSFFQCTAGVRQGENLSPILFAIYLNDFKEYLIGKSKGLTNLENDLEDIDIYVKLYTLLYADDTVILAESAADLQTSLNALSSYCSEWDLTVNLGKTKIVIFSKGRVTSYPVFKFNDKEVEVVDDYTYLGVVFNYNGNFIKAIANQKTVATRALNALVVKARALGLDADVQLDLFQRCIVPILLYGSEIWGFEEAHVKPLNVFYKGFLKRTLKLFKYTPTCMVYGETGQPFFDDLIANRMISFWAKLKYDEMPRLSKHILSLISNKNDTVAPSSPNPHNFSFPWLEFVKKTLNKAGVGYAFDSRAAHNPKHLSAHVKRQLRDARIQSWQEEIESKDICSMYKGIKEVPRIEAYLSQSDMSANLKMNLARFRTRCNYLPVTRNRFRACAASRLNCELCNNGDIGDETHYLFKCQHFAEVRAKLIPTEYQDKTPNVQLVYSLLSIVDLPVICKIAKFSKIIMKAFKTKKTVALSPLKVRSTHIMASGRVSKRPKYLNDYLV